MPSRIFKAYRVTEAIWRLAAILLVITSAAISDYAQNRGSISGTINPSTPGVLVVATNQVTSHSTRAEVNPQGVYSLKVRPGAYRLAVESPYVAKFDKTKNYGEHALVRDDSLENVIVSPGKETRIDFAVARKAGPIVNLRARKPLGAPVAER